jgi:competence protein ComEC
MENKRVWQLINLSLLLLLGFLILVVIQWPDSNLHLVFCNVGQGDASLVKWGDKQILVDGGPDNSVLSCLGKQMPFWDRRIELIVLTHPQADHLTGLIEVLKRYKVNRVVSCGWEAQTPEYEAFKQAVVNEGLSLDSVYQGEEIKLGQVEMKVIWPPSRTVSPLEPSEINEASVVLLGNWGEFDWLLTGDINQRVEKILVVLDSLQAVEVLKVAHHGSQTSSAMEFLEMTRPRLGVISVGKNSFGHPSQATLQRLDSVRTKVLRTDQLGTIEIVSDGKRWWTN